MSVRSRPLWQLNKMWLAKLANDERRAAQFLSGPLAEINRAVLQRAKALGAEAVLLTGSTARGKRTSISDLDYLVIGSKPRVLDLRQDIDLHTSDPGRFEERLTLGDSFVHWALDHGCVLWDVGVAREALLLKSERDLRPDPDRLRRQYDHLRAFASALVASGDEDAAHRESMAALSLGARWWLLTRGVSPLARSELPEQLESMGNALLASRLAELIYTSPSLDSQSVWLTEGVDEDDHEER